jgi:hypothetical protein
MGVGGYLKDCVRLRAHGMTGNAPARQRPLAGTAFACRCLPASTSLLPAAASKLEPAPGISRTLPAGFPAQAFKAYRIGATNTSGRFSLRHIFTDLDAATAAGVEAGAGTGAW